MMKTAFARTRSTWLAALAASGCLAMPAVQAIASTDAPDHPYLADFFVDFAPLPAPTDGAGGLGRVPTPTPQTMQKYERLVGQTIDPETTMDIIVGQPRVLRLNETPLRIQVPNEDVVSYLLISDREISISGKEAGTTLLNIWFPNPDDRRNPRILSYLVRVVPDPDERARAERDLRALESEINAAFPDAQVSLRLVGGRVLLQGQVATKRDARDIHALVSSSRAAGEVVAPPVLARADSPEGAPSLEDYIIANSRAVVNQLVVTGEAQISLRVTIAEVNRSAARTLGTNWIFVDNEQDFTIGQFSSGLIGSGLNAGIDSANVNLPMSYVSSAGHAYRVALNALRTLNLSRSLAEPTLTTMNGERATLKSGGQFPIPVVAGGTETGLLGVEFQDFGIILGFTPHVIGRDRIRLDIEFEASTRSNESSLSVGSGSVSGLDSRSFRNTVELGEGQTLAVAGLVQTNFSSASSRVPFFGDLPVVGFLFGSSSTSQAEQELLILVTPELVFPMEAAEVGPLPGTGIYDPSDLEFFLLNKLESNFLEDWRASARTDIVKQFGGRNYPYYFPDRITPFEQMRRSENMLISGPSGHSDNRSGR